MGHYSTRPSASHRAVSKFPLLSQGPSLKAEGIGELVRAVTALLGYVPSQSLAMAPLKGTRAEGAMRVDLPATDACAYRAMATAVATTPPRTPHLP